MCSRRSDFPLSNQTDWLLMSHHHSGMFDTIYFKNCANRNTLASIYFFLIRIPWRAYRALVPHPSSLSSVVKYVNKMSKVILQRGTKERRGLKEKTAIKFLRFSITLARGGPASSQSLAAGEQACSIESHIANPTHTKKGKKIIKYLFSLSHQRATPPLTLPTPPHSLY